MSCTDIRRINIYIFSTLPLDVENRDIHTPEPESHGAADDVFLIGISLDGEVYASGRMMCLIHPAYEYLYFLHAAA